MKSQTIRFRNMSSDIADKFMPESTYKRMVNCRSNNKNSKAGGVVENIPSTLAITPPAFGEAVTYVGGCVDSKRNAIIAFYRGSTPTTLFITSLDTKTKQEVFVLYTTLINVNRRVTHVIVMDDFLFWIDGAYKMRKINIVTATAAPTTSYPTSGDMLIDKFPPLYPPTVEAVADATFEGNNITNSTFQFAYAWEYADKEISSWSPYSKSVLPESTSDEDKIFPNNKINVVVKVGNSEVKKIHIGYRKGQSHDWQTAEILDKTKITIAGGESTYAFYNTKFISALVQADVVTNTNNPFYEAGTLALSRDNFIIYGLVKDGLSKPTDISLVLSWSVLGSATRTSTYKFGAIHEFGVVFRDENGRTDGVNGTATVETPFFTNDSSVVAAITALGQIPYIQIGWTVTGTVPSWAKTMSIVYLGNRTITSFVDYTLTGISDIGDYTYLDITRLNQYKSNISVLDPGQPNSILAPYTFTKGDRIRFIKDKNGAIFNTDVNDYELHGYVNEVTDSSGNILYKDMLYIDKINWSSLGIDEKAVFEIYTPKKEFADAIFYEISEVFAVSAGLPISQTGNLTDGDAYVFNRDMELFDVGEFVSDKDYRFDRYVRTPAGDDQPIFVPILATVKTADGIKIPSDGGYEATSFYKNTTGQSVTIVVSGKYEFTSETDDGMTFKIVSFSSSAILTTKTLESDPNGTGGGHRYYHKGDINETLVIPNNGYASLYFVVAAGHFITREQMILDFSVKIYKTAIGSSVTSFVESKNMSDYFESDEHSLGRPYVEIPTEETGFKNVIAYTEKLFPDTDINDTNRINSINIKQVPSGFGLISAMMVRGDVLKVLTPYKELSYYLGKEQYSDSKTTDNFLLSSNPIGTVNVYDSDHGTENPESLMSNANSLFYYDRKNATIVQSSNNGQVDIAEYGLKTYLREVTARINNSTASNVFIANNDKGSEILVVFVIDGVQEAVVFKNQDNLWSHFLELEDASGHAPQGTCSLGETLAIYLQGNAYLAEQGNGYNTFFGDSKSAVIETACNQEPISTKIFQSLNYQGVGKWNVQVATEATEENPYGMYTQITKGRQRAIEGTYSSDISPNLKTKAGTINPVWYANGMPMRGKVATLTLTNEDTTRVILDELTVGYINSQNM